MPKMCSDMIEIVVDPIYKPKVNPMPKDHVNMFRLLYSDSKKVNLRRSFKANLYPFKHLNPFLEEEKLEAKKRKEAK